jgi:hypothetical protein
MRFAIPLLAVILPALLPPVSRGAESKPAESKPNIILILADDSGTSNTARPTSTGSPRREPGSKRFLQTPSARPRASHS